ncbi:hypothetical protein X742_18295 [Mesorhizobium sp. LNHC232B00]|nr:hypothetical protein X742_18295 [Mesorhizobium sp. LNHC232B00]
MASTFEVAPVRSSTPAPSKAVARVWAPSLPMPLVPRSILSTAARSALEPAPTRSAGFRVSRRQPA